MNLQTVQQAMLKRAAEKADQKEQLFPSWGAPVAGLSGLGAMGVYAGGAGAASAALAAGPLAAVGLGAVGNVMIRGAAEDKLRTAQQAAAKPVPKTMQDQANALRIQCGQQAVRYPIRWENGQPVYENTSIASK
jgi:hypothetical protein